MITVDGRVSAVRTNRAIRTAKNSATAVHARQRPSADGWTTFAGISEFSPVSGSDRTAGNDRRAQIPPPVPRDPDSGRALSVLPDRAAAAARLFGRSRTTAVEFRRHRWSGVRYVIPPRKRGRIEVAPPQTNLPMCQSPNRVGQSILSDFT